MTTREDIRARAGEYVLGTLDDAERTAVEQDMASDAELRIAVDKLAARMTVLDATAPDDASAASLWERISDRIADVPQVLARSTSSTMSHEADEPAGQVLPFPPATERAEAAPARQFWRSLRASAIAASLMAALALGYLVGGFTSGQREPVVIVMLQTPQNTPGAIFEAFADNSVRIVPLEDFAVPEGQIMQVWTLYDKSVGPVSLGTMTQAQTTLLGGKPFPVPAAEQLYEITLEPAPGSPTGKPTGPILVKGFAQRPAG